MSRELPQWEIPKWHPDIGDASQEVAMLKLLAEKLNENQMGISIKYIEIEEGYLSLELTRKGLHLGEVQIVPGDPDKRMRYGLFMGEKDRYATNAEDVVKIISGTL